MPTYSYITIRQEHSGVTAKISTGRDGNVTIWMSILAGTGITREIETTIKHTTFFFQPSLHIISLITFTTYRKEEERQLSLTTRRRRATFEQCGRSMSLTVGIRGFGSF